MPSLFSRLKGKDGKKSKKGQLDLDDQLAKKPRWEGDAWARKTVDPEEVEELLRFSTEELKARGTMTSISALLLLRPPSTPPSIR